MRPIALSIVVLAGAIMAAAGTIAESLPDARRYNNTDTIGLLIVGAALAFLVFDLWMSTSYVDAPESSPNRAANDSHKAV